MRLPCLLLTVWLSLTLPAPAWAWQVLDGRLADDAGRLIHLRGLNWFGFETQRHVAGGLDRRNLQDMVRQMWALGFNAVRLPLCPQTLRGVPVSAVDPQRNPALAGRDSLALLDAVIEALDGAGLYILLDHHSRDCRGIDELWYGAGYREADWIADLRFLARRYGAVPHVLGIDLKNEPHGAATWGDDAPATDWNHAAERAGAAVRAVAPHWLIFVQGVGDLPDGDCGGGGGHWWGGNLEPAACHPLDPLALPADRLVYSPHLFGPDVYRQAYFDAPDFPANLPAIWRRHFGYLREQGLAVVPGEFGGRYGAGDAQDRDWHEALVDWLVAAGLTDAFYWSWNPDSAGTGGLLRDDWQQLRQDKLALLRRLWSGGLTDGDGDGSADAFDNCRDTFNPDQRDEDRDGYGTACDPDLDGSGRVDGADLQRLRARFGRGGGISDFDGDGRTGFADLSRLRHAWGRAPGPSALHPAPGAGAGAVSR